MPLVLNLYRNITKLFLNMVFAYTYIQSNFIRKNCIIGMHENKWIFKLFIIYSSLIYFYIIMIYFIKAEFKAKTK